MADISGYSFHFWKYLLIEIEGGVVVEVFVDILIGQFVGCFELAVVFHVFLDCFVCQMDAF